MYLSSEVATYIFYVYLTPSTHTLTLTSSYSHTVPPIITQSFSETTVNVSQLVQLTCQAQGSLPLTWTWLRNEVVLTSARVGYDRSGLESTLTISHVEEGDGGVYQCRVEQMAHRTAAAANELLVTRSKSTIAPLCLHIAPTNPHPLSFCPSSSPPSPHTQLCARSLHMLGCGTCWCLLAARCCSTALSLAFLLLSSPGKRETRTSLTHSKVA